VAAAAAAMAVAVAPAVVVAVAVAEEVGVEEGEAGVRLAAVVAGDGAKTSKR